MAAAHPALRAAFSQTGEGVPRLAAPRNDALGRRFRLRRGYPAGLRNMWLFCQSEETRHTARGQCLAGVPVVDAAGTGFCRMGAGPSSVLALAREHLFLPLLWT